jgi:DNA-binding CsgD family transcriptional regulator
MAKREITAREREVLMLVSTGVASREIAARLGISRATVESHVRSAMCKVGARTRLHAVLLLAAPDASDVASELEPEHRRLLELLASGLTREHAAQALFLSRRSVDRRLAALRRRVGVTSTAELLLAVLSPADVSPADVSRRATAAQVGAL